MAEFLAHPGQMREGRQPLRQTHKCDVEALLNKASKGLAVKTYFMFAYFVFFFAAQYAFILFACALR